MSLAVTVLIVVAHPSTAALGRALMHTKDTDVLALTIQTHQSISTLGPRQDQAGVGHVITQVDMRASAQYPPSILHGDIRLYGNSVGANYWAVSSSLTLDFTTFSISCFTFGKGAFGVLATVAIGVPC